jgi:hypothetical protein
MLGTIVLLLVIGAVLYLLYINEKLNANSLNESSGQSGDSSESLNVKPNGEVVMSSAKVKQVRLAHGENSFSKIAVTESPIQYDRVVEHGDRFDANTVFLGVLESALSGVNVANRQTANSTVRKFKNMFIVFKGVEFAEIDNTTTMIRYEANNMVYALVDASNATVPDVLRDVSYPIVVLTNNSSAQLVLKEWGYTQVNNAGTLFVKNEKSFRIQ